MRKLTWKFPLSIGWGEGQGEGRNWLKNALPRGLALFLGGFSLLNLLGNFHVAGFDANLWWIDLRALPNWLGNALLFVSAFTLLAFGLRPPQSRRRKALTISCASVLGIIATANALGFYVLAMGGSIDAGLPIPFSLFVCGPLGLFVRGRVDPSDLSLSPSDGKRAGVRRAFSRPPVSEISFGLLRYVSLAWLFSPSPKCSASAKPITAAPPMSQSFSAHASMPMAGPPTRWPIAFAPHANFIAMAPSKNCSSPAGPETVQD